MNARDSREEPSGVHAIPVHRVDHRIWCDQHADTYHRGCLGCVVAREWRRSYERVEEKK